MKNFIKKVSWSIPILALITVFLAAGGIAYAAGILTHTTTGTVHVNAASTGNTTYNFSVSPQTINFGEVSRGGTATANITITNTGTGTFSSFDVSAVTTGLVVTGGSANPLAPNDSQTITLTLTAGPDATLGTNNIGTISISGIY
jgi:subtilase family serine protease